MKPEAERSKFSHAQEAYFQAGGRENEAEARRLLRLRDLRRIQEKGRLT